ncbi:HAD-IA family hydrolase [Sediminicola sp. YIK13]|uniref:HAD-IA family hydrolase n=1 Tax=Sediminicola sp. YIK13 TaxID=1453352 RepID=UPI0011A2E2E1|nr:HAD-IA family hydrolase [Sediminicola sp. YIK13]
MSKIKYKIERAKCCKTIFTDLFDTLIHRNVHPKYTLRLWGKFIIRELGLSIDVDELFSIREEALTYLSKNQKLRSVEVDYDKVIMETYRRLANSNKLIDISYDSFERAFHIADYHAEISVQFKNETLIADLINFKENGYIIYLISDFYLPKNIIFQILEFHGISQLFEDIFVSCSLGLSKENGNIYPYVLEKTSTDPKMVIMMGDNTKSDVDNAERHEIAAIKLRHTSHKMRNLRNLFGDDAYNFDKACKNIELECQNSQFPLSEYILHFYFFTERLYIRAKKTGIKNLFFLSREGFYLKRLFDTYQEMNNFSGISKINTHYLKISRHSALQMSLKPLHEEDFSTFKGDLRKISAIQFLDGLDFSEMSKKQILEELGDTSKDVFPDFFQSEAMSHLRDNTTFAAHYESYRMLQKTAFDAYLKSFAVDFEKEGMQLVDVGWGGTMQENLFRFLGKTIPVCGYYLGLKEVYDIQPETKRYGMNFSVYPSRTITDEVLMANGQLYEQLLGAPHGSTVGYTMDNPESFALTFHEENEKQVFENLVSPVQEYMIKQFKNLFENLRPIDYPQDLAQQYLTDMALSTGIFSSKKNVEFIDQLSQGFYQNVGQNKVGLAYDPKQLKQNKLALLAQFIRSPEKLFRYLVKIKPFMYRKGLYWLSWPVNLTYYYIRFNFWFRKKWMNKGLLN